MLRVLLTLVCCSLCRTASEPAGDAMAGSQCRQYLVCGAFTQKHHQSAHHWGDMGSVLIGLYANVQQQRTAAIYIDRPVSIEVIHSGNEPVGLAFEGVYMPAIESAYGVAGVMRLVRFQA